MKNKTALLVLLSVLLSCLSSITPSGTATAAENFTLGTTNDPTYRPYATCWSSTGRVTLDIKQNVNNKDIAHPFTVTIGRTVNDEKTKFEALNFLRMPNKSEAFLESFQGENSGYFYSLIIMHTMTAVSTYKATFRDTFGKVSLVCSYQITFGN